MDAFIDALKNRNLPEVKVRLDEISEDLHREGLYFATYENMETLLIVSKDIKTTMFDLERDMNYDILITKTNNDLDFSLDSDKGNIKNWEPISYYKTRAHLNLIKIFQTSHDITLDTNFPSKQFNIKVDGKPMPAILFSKKDLQ